MAALALVRPSLEVRVMTLGCVAPVGHRVRWSREPLGRTATLREYAVAVAGMPQALWGISNSRLAPAASVGPPKAPSALRVSATRQGVTGINVAPEPAGGKVEKVLIAPFAVPALLVARAW